MATERISAKPATPSTVLAEALHSPIDYYAVYAGHLIPGVLQTKGYARSNLRRHYSPDTAEQHVAARMRYGQLIVGSAAVRAQLLVDESALHCVVGDRATTLEAVQHLGERILNPPENTIIGVLPFDDPDIIRPCATYYIMHRLADGNTFNLSTNDGRYKLEPGDADYQHIIDTVHPGLMESALTGPDAYAAAASAAMMHANRLGE